MHSERGSVACSFLAFVTILRGDAEEVCTVMVRETARCLGDLCVEDLWPSVVLAGGIMLEINRLKNLLKCVED